jgi:predicted Fe-Mo cluster-binding NifX family protein
MKIAVAAAGGDLDAQADPRFGRCAWFVIVDGDTMAFDALENAAATAGTGAGIRAAQAVAGTGAEAIIAGNYGPNAYQALAAAGIQAYVGAPGLTVRQAVEALTAGQLQLIEGPTAPAHAGMGTGAGAGGSGGRGSGGGRGAGGGMGGGGGRGMGGGRGAGGGGGMGRGGGGGGRDMGGGRGGGGRGR